MSGAENIIGNRTTRCLAYSLILRRERDRVVQDSSQNHQGATLALAKWSSTVSENWSDTARGSALHSLEDTLAAIIAGVGDTEAIRASLPSSANGVPIIGSLKCTASPLAALANGTSAHAREVDEMFYYSGGHFGCAVVPALLSVAYEDNRTLADVIDAIIVGTEVMARAGAAMNRSHPHKGWHSTSTVGVIAAAAACGRLLGLDTGKMTHAVSLAVSMAAGPKIQFGTTAKPLHAGLAAQGGVLSATLARAGVEGNPTALEGPQGFGELYAGEAPPDWSLAMPNDNEPLAIEQHGLAFKQYPCCASTHRCLDALQILMKQHGIVADRVQRVETLVGKVNLANLKFPDPKTPREAMFSMHYTVATMLRFSRVELADFSQEAIDDNETRRLMSIVEMQLQPQALAVAETGAALLAHTVKVTLVDGTVLEHSINHAKGMLQNPMSLDERRAKFEQCACGVLLADRCDAILAALTDRDQNVRSLLHLLRFEAESLRAKVPRATRTLMSH